MHLTILNVAYPLASVGPDAVGGAEQVVALLDRELCRAGHHSIVVAREGSRCAGTFVPVPAFAGTLSSHLHPAAQAACARAIRAALETWHVDVVHLHGLDFHAYLPPEGPPTLVTLHLPLDWYPAEALRATRPATYLHCVSASQRERGGGGVSFLPDIENAVPVDELAARHGKRRFAVAMGRICWEKGFHLALDAAARARFPLVLGGTVHPYAQHEAYFRDMIVPRLDARRRFLGSLGFVRKRRLLTAARALLVPSLVPETGSLVAMEALACGTPVIAFRQGALTSFIEDGVTGFLVDNADEMADALHAAASLDPEACRAVARKRFSVARMFSEYMEAYTTLASHADEHAPPGQPGRGSAFAGMSCLLAQPALRGADAA